MICLDASVLLALLNPADAHHGDAREVVLANRPLVVHEITMAECLVRAAKAGQAESVLDVLAELCEVGGSPGAAGALRLATVRAHSGLPLPDCCVLDLAIQRQASVATFDARLARAAARLGVHLALE